MTSKKSLSVKLALAISLLCFLLGCMFLALPNSLTKEVYAETHNHSSWEKWGDEESEQTKLPNAEGNYVLASDITLSSTWAVPNGEDAEHIAITNLCLNGYVIKFAGETGSVINIPQYATLNLYDCGTTSHNGYVDSTGLWHLDANDEHNGLTDEKDITGGVITGGNRTNSNGGGVYVNGGIFNMNGGTIAGNTATYGAGVYVMSGSFSMTGDSVISNNKGGQGVGVFSKGTFIMSESSKITGNKGTSYGGGVNIDTDGTFTMSGGSIEYNEANGTGIVAGGGVYVKGSFTMTGGSITNNKVNGTTNVFGGGVAVNGSITFGGSATIIDNTLTNNTLSDSTNNVFLFSGRTITLSSTTTPTTMNVGVTTYTAPEEDNPIQITTNGTADYSANFFADSDSYKVCVNNNGTDDNNADDYLELRTAYAITNNTTEDDVETNGGYIIAPKNAVENEEIVVTVVANAGYKLSSLKYNDGTDHDITATAGVYSFEMPNKDVSITAEFVKKITNEITGLTLTGWTYGDEPNSPSATSTYGEINYTYSTEENGEYIETKPTNAGTYYVKAEVLEGDEYKGAVAKLQFTISPKAITVTIESKTSVYGNAIVALTATDNGIVNGDENVYSLATTASSTSNVGTYNITGTVLDNNYFITFANETNAYKIIEKTLTNDAIQTIADQIHTGSAITPSIVVKDGEKTLVKDTDYTVAYSNNINVGTATATVTLQGNYSGTISKTFIINQVDGVCFAHWIMLGILIAGAALFALFQVFKKKLFAMITCILAIVGTILCIIFGGCTICIVFTIINLLAFLGGLAYTLTQQKDMTKEDTNKNTK